MGTESKGIHMKVCHIQISGCSSVLFIGSMQIIQEQNSKITKKCSPFSLCVSCFLCQFCTQSIIIQLGLDDVGSISHINLDSSVEPAGLDIQQKTQQLFCTSFVIHIQRFIGCLLVFIARKSKEQVKILEALHSHKITDLECIHGLIGLHSMLEYME